MSVPAVLGAALLELKDASGESVTAAMAGNYAAGMITAAVVGYIAIKTMILVVKKKKYIIFSIYCMAAGLLAVCGYFFMK